jgi:hypothetical protein
MMTILRQIRKEEIACWSGPEVKATIARDEKREKSKDCHLNRRGMKTHDELGAARRQKRED